MSAINDALKRVSEAQQEQDTVRIRFDRLPVPYEPPSVPRESPSVPREPASVPTPKPNAVPGMRWAPPVLVIVMIAATGALIVRAHFSRKHPAQVTAIVPVSKPVPAISPAPRPVSVQTVAVTAQAPVPVPTSWPSLNVQAIFYSGAKSQAIVNGQTVYAGSSVGRIRVAEISRNNVLFVAPDGTQKKLALGE